MIIPQASKQKTSTVCNVNKFSNNHVRRKTTRIALLLSLLCTVGLIVRRLDIGALRDELSLSNTIIHEFKKKILSLQSTYISISCPFNFIQKWLYINPPKMFNTNPYMIMAIRIFVLLSVLNCYGICGRIRINTVLMIIVIQG